MTRTVKSRNFELNILDKVSDFRVDAGR